MVGGLVVSWFVLSTPNQVVQIQVLPGDIEPNSWGRRSQSASLHPGV